MWQKAKVNTMSDAEYENLMSSYYGDDAVRSMIGIKVETSKVDEIAEKVAEFPQVLDLFLVTGEVDMLLKAVFRDYSSFREFVTNTLPSIDGIKETNTFMVVTAYKEGGQKVTL